MQKKTNAKPHYAYIILISIILQKFIISAEPAVAGLFLLPVTKSLRITQGSFMLYQTVQYSALAVTSTFVPKLMRHFRYTTLNKLGLISMSCGIACMGLAQNVWMFYLGGAMNGAGLAVSNFLLIGTMIPRWFRSNVGLLIATATLGGTASGMIANPLVSHLLNNETMLGIPAWRAVYFLLALLPAGFGFLNAALLMKESPEELGIQKWGDSKTSQQGKVSDRCISQEQAVKSVSFLWLIVTVITWNVATTMGAYLPAYVQTTLETGGQELKGYIGIATTIGSLAGSYLLGFINDKFGGKIGVVLAAFCGTLGSILLLLGRNSGTVIWAGALILGIYFALNSVQLPVMVSNMYGDKDYDGIFHRISSLAAWFGAFSASMWGFLYDFSGSYTPMLLIATVLCVLTGWAGVWAVNKSKEI